MFMSEWFNKAQFFVKGFLFLEEENFGFGSKLFLHDSLHST